MRRGLVPYNPIIYKSAKLLELPMAVFGPNGPKELIRQTKSVDICLQRLSLAKGGFKGDEPA